MSTSEVLNNTKDKTKSLIQKNFIKNVNAKGLSTTKTIFRHLLKNIVIPIIPKIGNQFSTLVTFAIITETIFSWPGIGRWLLFAMEHQSLEVTKFSFEESILCKENEKFLLLI